MSQNNELREALQALHDDIADYQRINHLGGYDNHNMKRARAALAAQAAKPAEPYDQTSLELCSVCGWKALIPGDCCLNCEHDRKAQPQQSAVMPNFARYRDDDLFCEMERVPDGMWVMYDDVAAAWPKAINPTEGTP